MSCWDGLYLTYKIKFTFLASSANLNEVFANLKVEALLLGEVNNLPKGLERENQIIQTILGRILFALDGLHSTGIVHRDIKPQNIIFSEGDCFVPTLLAARLNSLSIVSFSFFFFFFSFFFIKCDAGSRTFKIIDHGAAADLRVGINYIPKEFLLDPR